MVSSRVRARSIRSRAALITLLLIAISLIAVVSYSDWALRRILQVRALIFLTGGAFSKETAVFLDSVANPRVEKPFDAAKLRARVEAHLAEHATRPPGEAA